MPRFYNRPVRVNRIVGIYICVFVFYAIVALSAIVCVGVSMANVDGHVNDEEAYRMIIQEISPALVYVFALFVLAITAMFSKDTSRVQLAIVRMFQFHILWFVLAFFYSYAAPLAPELLSFRRSPGAAVMRSISIAWPLLMLLVFGYFCVEKWVTVPNENLRPNAELQ